ncbi:hypothetical protein [Kitasatospora sp. MAP5-34]|uniref:hypothetical protein n=1 Tax=Kitasatospora sp. MAP5-34 TaxID=3035102 RepID=UPI002475A512|nr:hypothetical protein [Kitasatospora sp. MAP5-34]MDH6579112.1 hypothetical protein [Kitasatospora sp. MAP5-34]
MANDQSTTAVPASAEPQVPVAGTGTTQPVAAAPAEHTVTTPDILPDLQDLIGGASLAEPKTDGTEPGDDHETTGIIASRP